MRTIFLLLAILAAILFPVFLVRAIRAEEKVEATNNTVGASICLGYLAFVMVAG